MKTVYTPEEVKEIIVRVAVFSYERGELRKHADDEGYSRLVRDMIENSGLHSDES